MKRTVCRIISVVCALSVAAVTMGLAYQSGEEIEPTVAELEEMASSVAEIYETEPLENPEDIEFLDMSTEEIIESSNEYIAQQLAEQGVSYSEEQSVVEQFADQAGNYSLGSIIGTDEEIIENHGDYSTEAIESDVSFFTFESSVPESEEESIEEVIPESYVSDESSDEVSSDLSEEEISSEPSSEETVPEESSENPSSNAPSETPSSSQTNTSSGSSGGNDTGTGDTLLLKVNGTQYEMRASEVLPIFMAYEMSSSWSTEALKAQAVATHTYIKYYNKVYGKAVILPTLSSSKQKEAQSASIQNACKAVCEEMIYYNGSVIDAQYCAAMAGVTRNASDVYQSGSYAYLTSVESKYESYGGYWDYKIYISASDFKKMVESYDKWKGIDLGLSSISPEKWIQIIDYTADGYVNKVKIGNYETTGWYLYCATSGKTKSAWFNVEYNSSTNTFTFTTRGFGHCVGMSQYGALYYAQYGGWTYKQILTHYYQGTTVK